jgi:hypothetical protein
MGAGQAPAASGAAGTDLSGRLISAGAEGMSAAGRAGAVWGGQDLPGAGVLGPDTGGVAFPGRGDIGPDAEAGVFARGEAGAPEAGELGHQAWCAGADGAGLPGTGTGGLSVQRLRCPRRPADRATAPEPVAGLAASAVSLAARGAGSTRPAGGPAMERTSPEPGPALAASGTTPARRIRPLTSAACAGVCRVITTPAAPARAVRPDRCR